MRFAAFELNGRRGLAVERNAHWTGLFADEEGYPGNLDRLIADGANLEAVAKTVEQGHPVDIAKVRVLAPLSRPGKIVCVGLNYRDHSAEAGFEEPDYPTVFARFATSLTGPYDAIAVPPESSQLDYEGELVAVIGKGGRHIPVESALDHVAGYSVFNDATLRDFQFRTPQWTMGKNFDGTGALGPYFVPSVALPPGCKGLRLQTRLNGEIVQDADTADMVFDVATLVSLLSVTFTLEAGDVIVTGTPAGVGMAHKPPLWMKPGDVCEVEIEKIGILRNPVVGGSTNAR
ncbi:fumarylacetoacetate hydrolase family protein [Paraburkholderia pallida]|uniref:FAA hydrolase family protein n=1 Tax=Paraburkholderia pallida TaxID=2547399 RepID=A0A4P7D001_9BURK|nr:fumarylacetoacetate hydrolase family protein [Paraburkholderia pallida]QBR01936.1 FAA hydrolase family protein [Paraburkholderia pallida]